MKNPAGRAPLRRKRFSSGEGVKAKDDVFQELVKRKGEGGGRRKG